MKGYEDFCDLLSILFVLLFMKTHVVDPPLASVSVLYEDTKCKKYIQGVLLFQSPTGLLSSCQHSVSLLSFIRNFSLVQQFPINRVGLSTTASLFVYELLK